MNNKVRAAAARAAIRSQDATGVVVLISGGTVVVTAEGESTAPMFAALRAADIEFDADGEGDYSTGEGDWVQCAYLR